LDCIRKNRLLFKDRICILDIANVFERDIYLNIFLSFLCNIHGRFKIGQTVLYRP